MKVKIPGQKGYNIYQTRVYSIMDQLEVKNNFIDFDKAWEYIWSLFKDEHYGVTYFRGIIRRIDPFLSQWLVAEKGGVNNPDALLLDPQNTLIDKWKYTYYSHNDELMDSEIFNEKISDEILQKQMKLRNCMYIIIAGHEIGSPKNRCQIIEQVLNKSFRIFVFTEKKPDTKLNEKGMNKQKEFNEKGSALYSQNYLVERYQHLIDSDRNETLSIYRNRIKEFLDSNND